MSSEILVFGFVRFYAQFGAAVAGFAT